MTFVNTSVEINMQKQIRFRFLCGSAEVCGNLPPSIWCGLHLCWFCCKRKRKELWVESDNKCEEATFHWANFNWRGWLMDKSLSLMLFWPMICPFSLWVTEELCSYSTVGLQLSSTLSHGIFSGLYAVPRELDTSQPFRTMANIWPLKSQCI